MNDEMTTDDDVQHKLSSYV